MTHGPPAAGRRAWTEVSREPKSQKVGRDNYSQPLQEIGEAVIGQSINRQAKSSYGRQTQGRFTAEPVTARAALCPGHTSVALFAEAPEATPSPAPVVAVSVPYSVSFSCKGLSSDKPGTFTSFEEAWANAASNYCDTTVSGDTPSVAVSNALAIAYPGGTTTRGLIWSPCISYALTCHIPAALPGVAEAAKWKVPQHCAQITHGSTRSTRLPRTGTRWRGGRLKSSSATPHTW